jgi:rhodanese-related sulfurtransferase
MKTITPQQLRRHWIDGHEIALFDVREEGPYADAHPFFALTLPVSDIEVKLPALVPRLSAPIVVYDDEKTKGYAQEAASRILALGYLDVAILEGGLSGYARVGEVFQDVNVPSKAFGELVHDIRKTPSVPAAKAKEILENEKDLIVLDARRYEEYHTMSLPRGQSCPGGELLYRLFEVAPSPSTTVIVHCAGRTRSIIGTQSLVNAGIDNKVVALENGTIGWTLAGFTLDKGKAERARKPSEQAVRRAKEYAGKWAKHVGVRFIGIDELRHFISESAEERTLYLLDVRDPQEYAEGHPEGFVSAPGGQLVQATDEWIGVRGGRVVLYDDDGVRATMTATWLVQLGWDVYVVREGVSIPDDLPRVKQPSLTIPDAGAIAVEDLESEKFTSVAVVDLARSPVYNKGHIPGAWLASGPELARDLESLPGTGPIVITSPDGSIAAFQTEKVRAKLGLTGFSRDVFYLRGGTAAWKALGRSLETETRWLSEPIDVYKRPYEGTDNAKEAMQGYIDWEHGLVAQLANDGVSGFHVVRDIPV